jgi:hypothetical protein
VISTSTLLALPQPVRVLPVTGLAFATVDVLVVTVDILTLVVTRRRDGGHGTR